MPEIKNYSQWSADNALDKDPIDALREYTDYARMQYLRSGVPMNTVEPELRAGIEDKLKADGLLSEETTPEQLSELQTRLFAPKTNLDFDAAVVQNYLALDDPDSGDEETKNNSALLRDYLAKKKYSAELAAPLEGAVKDLLQDSALVRRARVAAVDRGEYNAIAVTEDDGTRNVYAGSRDLEDSEIPMVAESLVRSGALDTSDIVGLQDNYRKVFGGKSTLNQNARSAMFNDALDSLSKTDSEIADILGGAASAAAKQEALSREGFVGKAAAFAKGSLASPFVGLGEAVGAAMGLEQPKPTGVEIAEYQFRQGDGTAAEMIRQKLLENPAMRKRFSEQEITAFTNDRVLKQTDYKFDNTKPESGLRQLSTGEVNIAPALLVSPQKLEDALGKAPLNEDQKEFARRQRAALLDVRVPQMLKLISSSSDEAVSAYATAKQNGVGDREFVEQWLSNEDNYGMFSNTASSLAYSGIQALGSVPIGIASLLGSETATTIMLRSQAKQARYAEYGALFGDEFGLTREALTALPAVAVDIALTIGTAGVGRAVSAAARAGSMSARTLAKGAVGVLDDAALAAVRGASAGAAAETSAALQAAGRSWISKAATTAVEQTIPVALPAFTRSASSTYVSIYGSLPEDMTHEEKHKQAIGFALAAGVGTAAITAGLSALGAGGVEKLGVRTAAKGLDDLTYREAKVLFETVKNEGKAVSNKAFRGALAAEVGGNYKRLIGSTAAGFRDEAFEEALDQSINMAIEDAALKKNRPLAEKLQQVWNAGLIGGVLGGGINVASQAFTPTASAQTKALQQRTAVLDGIAKRLSTSNAPETAASVQRMMDDANAAAVASTKKDTAAAAAQAAKAPTTAVRTVAEQLEFKFDDPRGVPPADTRLADLIGERVYIGDTGINGIAEIDTTTGEVVINFSKPTKVKGKPNVTRYVLGTKFQKATGVTLKPKIKTLAKPVGTLPVGTRIFNTNKMEFVLPTVEAVDKARAAGKPLLVLQRDENQRVVGVTVRGASLVASPTTTTDTTITDPDLIREVLRLYPEPAPAPAPATDEQLELDFASPDGQFEFGFMSNQTPQPTPEEVADQAELDSLGGPQEIQLTFDDAPDFDEIRGSVALIDSLIGDDPVLTALHATRIDQKGFSALASTFDPDQIADAGEALQEAQEAAAALLGDPEALSDPKRFRQNSLLFVQLNKTLDPLRVKYDRIVQIRNQNERRTRSAAKRSDAVQRSQRAATRPAAQPVGRTESPRPAGPPRDVEALTELLNADPVLAALNTTGGNNLRSLLGTFSGAQRTAAQDLLAEAEGLVAQQPAPALQQRLRILNFKLTGLNRLAATQQQPEAPAPEPTPTPEPEPEPTTPRGQNRVPKLQEFMDKDPELAALVEEALAAGTDILFATSRAQAVTELGLPELPPNRKSSRTLATAFVRTDGSTGIVLYSGAMQKGKDLKKIIAHERIHVEQFRFEDTPEGAAAAAAAEATFDTESPEYDKKLDSFMRKEYPSWDKLSPRGKLREANRAAVEGLLTGETSHFKPGFFSYITRFLRHVQEVFQGDSSMATYTRAVVEQISKEAPKLAAKKAARKAAPAPAPAPTPAAKKAARKAPKAEPTKQEVLDEVAPVLMKLGNDLAGAGKMRASLSKRKDAREISEKLSSIGFAPTDTPEGYFRKTPDNPDIANDGDPSEYERLVGAFKWASGQPEPVVVESEPELEPDNLQERLEALIADEARRGVLIGKVVQLRLYPENSTRTDTVPLEIVGFDEGDILAVDPGTNKSRATTYPLDEFVLESFTKYLEAGNTEPEAGAPAAKVIAEKNKPVSPDDKRITAPVAESNGMVVFERPDGSRYQLLDNSKTPEEYQNLNGQSVLIPGYDKSNETGGFFLTAKSQQRDFYNFDPETPTGDTVYAALDYSGRSLTVNATELFNLGATIATKPAEPEPSTPPVDPKFRKALSKFVAEYTEDSSANVEWSSDKIESKIKKALKEGYVTQVEHDEALGQLKSRELQEDDTALLASLKSKEDRKDFWESHMDNQRGQALETLYGYAQTTLSRLDPQAGTLSMLAPQDPLRPVLAIIDGDGYLLRNDVIIPDDRGAGQTLAGTELVRFPDGSLMLASDVRGKDVFLDRAGGYVVSLNQIKKNGPVPVTLVQTTRVGEQTTWRPTPALTPVTPTFSSGTLSMLAPQGAVSGRLPGEPTQRTGPLKQEGAMGDADTQLGIVVNRVRNRGRDPVVELQSARKNINSALDKEGLQLDDESAAAFDTAIAGLQNGSDFESVLADLMGSLGYEKFGNVGGSLPMDTVVYDDLEGGMLPGDPALVVTHGYRFPGQSTFAAVIKAGVRPTPEGTLSTLALPDGGSLRQNIADIPAALRGMLPAGFTLVADPNMDGALGYNAVTAPTTVFYNPNLVGSITIGLSRADGMATLRTAVDHELGHAAAEAEFGEEAYAALATELGEDMLTNIASIYYSLLEPDFNLRAERIKADRESGALPDWKIAAEWVRMEIERIANGRTSEQRMLFLRSRPSLLAKFIDALDAFVTRLRARFFEQPTTGTAASISNAARQLRKLKNGGYLPAAPKADPNALGDAAEFERALTGASDSTLFSLPIGAATKAGQAEIDGFWRRLGKRFENLPSYLKVEKEARDGIMAVATNQIEYFQKRVTKLMAKAPTVSLDDVRDVLGRTAPALDNAARARVRAELDVFINKLPADMDGVLAEEMIQDELYRLQRVERIASNTAFAQQQADAQQRIRNSGNDELADLLVKFRKDIDNMSERFKHLNTSIDDNLGVYLTRTFDFFTTEGWSLMASNKGVMPDGTQLAMFRGKEVDFNKLRDNAAKAYEADVVAEAQRRGEVATAEEIQERTHEKLDKYLAALQRSTEQYAGTNTDSIKKDIKRFLPKRDLDNAVLDLLGVIEDPIENAMRTMANVAKIAANDRFLSGARSTLLSMGLASNKPDAKNSTPAFGKRYADAALDPLEGLYTTPEIARALQAEFGEGARRIDSTTDTLMQDVGTWVRHGAAFATTMKTLPSVGFHARNMVSGQFLLTTAQGVAPANKHTLKAFKLSLLANFESRNRTPEEAAEIERLIELQMLRDDTSARALKDMTRGFEFSSEQELDSLFLAYQEAASGNPGALKAIFKKAGVRYDKTIDILASLNNVTDGAVKVQAYYTNLEVLKADKKQQLAQEAADPEQRLLRTLELKAADKTKLCTPTHSRRFDWVKSMNKTSAGLILFPFAGWKTEVFRTMYNIPRLAYKEITQGEGPAERAMGVKRLVGWTTVMFGAGKAMGFAYQMIFGFLAGLGDEEDRFTGRELAPEELFALRESMPEWQKGHDVFTRLTESGVMVIDMTAITPYAQLTDMGNIILEGIQTGEGPSGRKVASYVVNQLIGMQIAAKTASEIWPQNQNAFGQPIYRENDDAAQVFGKSMLHYMEGAMEPAISAFVRKVTRTGEQDVKEMIVGEFTGARPRIQKLSEIEYRAFRGVKKMLDDSAQIKSSLVTGRKLDDNEVEQTLLEHQEALNQTQRKLAKTVEGLKGLGSTRGSIFSSAKNAGFSAQRVELAEQGRNYRWTPNQAWLKGVYQNMTRTGEDDPMNRINAIRRTLSGQPAVFNVVE